MTAAEARSIVRRQCPRAVGVADFTPHRSAIILDVAARDSPIFSFALPLRESWILAARYVTSMEPQMP